MITPEDVQKKALKLWNSQEVHRAHLADRSLFPWQFPVPRSKSGKLADDFYRTRETIQLLRKSDKEVVGFGYRAKYQKVNHRRLGDQSLPNQIVIDSLDDFLHLIGKREEFHRFADLSAMILAARPELKPLLIRRPGLILDYADDWSRLLAVCRYFQEHPRPGLYLRQLEIPDIHTKFIESRRAILAELLEIILPPELKAMEITGLSNHGFDRRYGLKIEAPLIRFRLLDGATSLAGLTDISATLPEFSELSLPIRRIFLIENKMNGLCFPRCTGTMAIFGLGYGAACLENVLWLQKTAMFYWGDIDTHGFSILDQLRGIFPKMRSFLMDEGTLLLFRELWGRENPTQRFMKDLTRLSPEERTLLKSLRDNHWGDSIRLEQERIAFGHVRQAVAEIVSN